MYTYNSGLVKTGKFTATSGQAVTVGSAEGGNRRVLITYGYTICYTNTALVLRAVTRATNTMHNID